jgi:hypothetical protein
MVPMEKQRKSQMMTTLQMRRLSAEASLLSLGADIQELISKICGVRLTIVEMLAISMRPKICLSKSMLAWAMF